LGAYLAYIMVSQMKPCRNTEHTSLYVNGCRSYSPGSVHGGNPSFVLDFLHDSVQIHFYHWGQGHFPMKSIQLINKLASDTHNYTVLTDNSTSSLPSPSVS